MTAFVPTLDRPPLTKPHLVTRTVTRPAVRTPRPEAPPPPQTVGAQTMPTPDQASAPAGVPAAASIPAQPRSTPTGLFDLPTADTSPTPRVAASRTGEFGDGAAASGEVRLKRVSSGGTGDGGFGLPPAPELEPATHPASSARPLAVLVVPVPEYTDEARRLSIEGDVVLDVVFSATGQVRVLGITKGLGHGLDEAAMRAAARIEFSAARDENGPVDKRSLVRILFRLAR